MSAERFLGQQPLLSAELHYFRAPRDDWEMLLARLRQIGANTISTYVPWSWHEPRRGAFDLTGATDPRRDLAGFVALCGQLGLRVILKPGPFCDAELLGGGIPPWLLNEHPEIVALRADGEIWRHSDSGVARVCYLHPTYLDAARRWIDAFSAAVLPLQHPHGPIIALQADNETPGDGMLPADIGLDPRLRLDYNLHVVETLWPRWRSTAAAPAAPPRAWSAPGVLDDLRAYAALNMFTDWYYAEAVATVAGWLRAAGWQAPIFHDLLAAPWEAGGTIVDIGGMARAAGWLGHNVYPEDVRAPFVGDRWYRYSFEEYVHYAFWRTRLVAHLSAGYPSFAPEISAAQDFFFMAPFVGGLQGANIYMAAQTQPDQPGAGAFTRWAMEAPIRPDGSVRVRFWNARNIFLLLGAAGADYAAAALPARIAVGYSHVPEQIGAWMYRFDYLNEGAAWEPEDDAPAELHQLAQGIDHAVRSQQLAQELVHSNVTFDLVDVDAAAEADLARYALVMLPATAILAEATQERLARCGNLAIMGNARTLFDEHLEPCTILDAAEHAAATGGGGGPFRMPAETSGAQIAEMIDGRDDIGRYAWPDEDDVDVSVRHGAEYTYLFLANRRPMPYSGTIAYRSPDGAVQHLHVNIGALRAGAAVLRSDEVIGVAMGGDASEGIWMVRGMHSSIVFNGGAGVIAPCGRWLLFSAPQSGRFQMRRPEGWTDIVAYRLLLSGHLLPALYQTEVTHASIPYIAEDENGVTDMYLLAPAQAALSPYLRQYLATLLGARAAALTRAGQIAAAVTLSGEHAVAVEARGACAAVATACAQIAAALRATADHVELDIRAYADAWRAADDASAAVVHELGGALTHARRAHLAGVLPQPAYEPFEACLAQLVEIVARAGLGADRE
jgi:hypothetical protein